MLLYILFYAKWLRHFMQEQEWCEAGASAERSNTPIFLRAHEMKKQTRLLVLRSAHSFLDEPGAVAMQNLIPGMI